MVSKSNVSSLIKLVSDGKDHVLFELNQLYRFSFSQAKEVVYTLSDAGVLELNGHSFRVRRHLTKKHLAYVYRVVCHRELHLEQEIIDGYKTKALNPNDLSMPNFERLDEKLLVDE